ncbi:MAG: hypothetical protein IPG63_07580 [Xanthomonadales bacterium]|nr:hypothetical protein [Xanthomonadales bacterium]MCC6562128.1 hypothetical protein [Xanthomonadales bacterium]
MSLTSAVNPDRYNLLLERYPELFPSPGQANHRTRPRFDFGEGWFNIVERLLGCYAWTLVVDSELRDQPPVILAIREHRGALQIDFAASAPWCNAMARLAETEASQVCEVCGEPGAWSEADQGQVRCKSHRRHCRMDDLDSAPGTDGRPRPMINSRPSE